MYFAIDRPNFRACRCECFGKYPAQSFLGAPKLEKANATLPYDGARGLNIASTDTSRLPKLHRRVLSWQSAG